MNLDTSAKINGLFNDIEELKNVRKRDMELIKAKEEHILKMLKVGQEVIVYKNDEPYVLSVNLKRSTKFDKPQLANDIGVSQSRLNIPGVAELTEKGKITTSKLEDYWNEEEDVKLKAKKATQKGVDRLLQMDIADFIE